MASSYNIVASTNQSTVVSEYIPDSKRSDSYQTEAELEQEFIRLLSTLGYEYLTIKDEQSLISNLRLQLERLNNFSFTDNEWERFFKNNIASNNDGIIEKTRKIQADHVQILNKDDGLTKNIYLLDKKNIHNNRLQVINQYEVEDGKYKITYKPAKKLPVEEFLRPQKRFKHMFKPGNEWMIEEFQKEVDKRWQELLDLEELTNK